MLLNVDAGEGFNNEELLFPYVDVVNVSCGVHAGSSEETERVILLAKKHQIKIGAHPSYPDREHFGRVVIDISNQELKESLHHQLQGFFDLVNDNEIEVFHVKPHGALYHEIATNSSVASVFFEVLKELTFTGKVIGSPNSLYAIYCKKYKLSFLPEGFADRRYNLDGSLMNRYLDGAVLTDQNQINNQVVELIKDQIVSVNNEKVKMITETICFHGDHVGSEMTLKNVREYIDKL